jgi:4-amino-4-deoxy-L-arabinose transferase-like glycosyltransferase
MELALPRPRSLPRVRVRRPPLGLTAVLLLAAVLVGWGLTRSGYSNTYYAAAVKSASESWKALFFGSLDPGSFITVDKPPLSLWVMGLSARVFGFSSFSMLLPQAVCTVGSVALLHATVKRFASERAALASALALAVMPVSVAIGRVNNPDALLVLLLVLSGYLTVRAIESGRTKHLAWAGAVVGLAFMTKMLQGWMVVPALALAYALYAPTRPAVRIRQLAIAGATMVAVSAAWPLAVTLWPGSKPYIGGSTDGSVWDLILGYNGFGRLFGEGAGPGGGGAGMGFGGSTGVFRLFNAQVGGQVAWLLPLAAAGLIAGLWRARGRERAGYVLFGTWALVHAVVFSFQQGIFHPYYVSALAPAVAVLAGAGGVELVKWSRSSWAGLVALEGALLGTAWLAVALLARTADFAPWLRTLIPVVAAVAAFAAVVARHRPALVATLAAAAVLAGPAAYSVATAGQGLNGNNVSAGPASAQQGFRMGGDAASTSDDALISYLTAHQGSAKYLVATTGSRSSASIIIASGKPVITIGGFNGQDPAPTLAQFRRLVASGQVSYVLVSGGGGGPGGGSNAITEWVQSHGTAVSSISGLYRV